MLINLTKKNNIYESCIYLYLYLSHYHIRLFITWWGYLAMNSASTFGVEGTR